MSPVLNVLSVWRVAACFFAGGFAALCNAQHGVPVTVRPEVIRQPGSSVAGRAAADDVALFLAGMVGRPDSPLAPLESTRAWQRHRDACDEMWGDAQSSRHGKMREWAAAEVLPTVGQPGTIFYMFGGPDFVTVEVFFPRTPVFILAGLEPVGEPPDLEALPDPLLDASLENLRNTIAGVLRTGFFKTKDIRASLSRMPVQGVEPMILAMMVRTGNAVLDRASFSPGGAVEGLRIVYRARSGGAERHCYYLKGDLSNGSQCRVIQDYLSRHRPAGTYLKAASYLMHEESFSSIRAYLLANSTFILQDDSGIPLRAFDRATWDIYPFGSYAGVMPAFEKYYQPDLAALYSRGGLRMPFGLGYRTADAEASQILAVRRRGIQSGAGDGQF